MGKIRKYGLDWPDTWHPAMIELTCWKHSREPPYCHAKLLPPADHFFNATNMLFTREQYTPDPWSRRMVEAWCKYDLIVCWGAASCGKSQTFGLLALLDYITDINDTVTLMCSTSKGMLALRSFASVKQYYTILKKNKEYALPVKEAKAVMAICNDLDAESDEDILSTKAGVRGVAVAEGTEEESRTKLQGAHLPYARLILDESEAMRDSAFAVRSNMSIGAGKSFKFVMLCNPASYKSKTAYFAEPKEGWGSIGLDSEMWETKVGGVCLRFDGFKSPAIVEPDGPRKYPYLITQEQIDRVVEEAQGNLDAPEIWQMIRALPPPAGAERALLTEKELIAFEAQSAAIWANEGDIVRLASLDPAFTSDGDSCVFQTATVGRLNTGQAAIAFDPPQYVPILASSPRPVTFQIADYVRKALAEQGVPVANLAVDDSGTQSVADVIDVEIGRGCTRYNYGTKPSERPLSYANPTPARDRCKNLVTEMHILSAEFVRARQVRALGDKAAQQWTGRRFRKDGAIGRILEGKRDYKKRTGQKSPDEGDAAVMICTLARDRFGFLPGGALGAIACSNPSIMIGGSVVGRARKILSHYGRQWGGNKISSISSVRKG
jgi:hypothetical protein